MRQAGRASAVAADDADAPGGAEPPAGTPGRDPSGVFESDDEHAAPDNVASTSATDRARATCEERGGVVMAGR